MEKSSPVNNTPINGFAPFYSPFSDCHKHFVFFLLAGGEISQLWSQKPQNVLWIRTEMNETEEYPNRDYPWTFYFNGVTMPKWGSCWTLLMKTKRLGFAAREKEYCSDVGLRDVFIIQCRIDHVGMVESADPDVFIYAVQEVLCTLLTERDAILENVRHVLKLNEEAAKNNRNNLPIMSADASDVYNDLVEAALQMRELTKKHACAFWTSGYEADNAKLIEAMRRAALPLNDPDYQPPPHIKSLRHDVEWMGKEQITLLHRVASSGGLSKDLRKRLLDI